jgi:hypothetical protein
MHASPTPTPTDDQSFAGIVMARLYMAAEELRDGQDGGIIAMRLEQLAAELAAHFGWSLPADDA